MHWDFLYLSYIWKCDFLHQLFIFSLFCLDTMATTSHNGFWTSWHSLFSWYYSPVYHQINLINNTFVRHDRFTLRFMVYWVCLESKVLSICLFSPSSSSFPRLLWNIEKFGAKYFIDHDTPNTIRFRDSVPVHKMHDCYFRVRKNFEHCMPSKTTHGKRNRRKIYRPCFDRKFICYWSVKTQLFIHRKMINS